MGASIVLGSPPTTPTFGWWRNLKLSQNIFLITQKICVKAHLINLSPLKVILVIVGGGKGSYGTK